MERLGRKEIDLWPLAESHTVSTAICEQEAITMLRFDLPTISWRTPMPGKRRGARVWAYTIGGYQVIKKWLSDREHKLLGRPLTTDEAREVMNIAFFQLSWLLKYCAQRRVTVTSRSRVLGRVRKLRW